MVCLTWSSSRSTTALHLLQLMHAHTHRHWQAGSRTQEDGTGKSGNAFRPFLLSSFSLSLPSTPTRLCPHKWKEKVMSRQQENNPFLPLSPPLHTQRGGKKTREVRRRRELEPPFPLLPVCMAVGVVADNLLMLQAVVTWAVLMVKREIVSRHLPPPLPRH